MIFVYVGVPLFIVVSIFVWLSKKKDKTLQSEIYDMLTSFGTLNGYMYQIRNDEFQLHMIKISANAELVINSATVWEVHQGSGSRLIDQKSLKDGHKKLVIVYPIATPIKRYINENEMVFISHKDYFHDMHVVRMDELEIFLKGNQS